VTCKLHDHHFIQTRTNRAVYHNDTRPLSQTFRRTLDSLIEFYVHLQGTVSVCCTSHSSDTVLIGTNSMGISWGVCGYRFLNTTVGYLAEYAVTDFWIPL